MTDRSAQARATSELGRLVRRMAAAGDEHTRLHHAVRTAVAVVGACDRAGVLLRGKDGPVAAVGSDDRAEACERTQVEEGEGPAVEAFHAVADVVEPDTGAVTRWPRWQRATVAGRAPCAVISMPLVDHRQRHGVLSLYADLPHAFGDDDLVAARALAAHVTVALAAGREIDQLGRAVRNRTVIGQAEGILMERLDLDEDQAFDYLRRVSQERNVKVLRLAADLVRTRQLPNRHA